MKEQVALYGTLTGETRASAAGRREAEAPAEAPENVVPMRRRAAS